MSILVQEYLCSKGIDCSPTEVLGAHWLRVRWPIGEHTVELLFLLAEPICSMPSFLLVDPDKYGTLAHVSVEIFGNLSFGSICVNDTDSVSVNFSSPELAVEESLKRHTNLLEKAILDKQWNKSELLREFYSCWLRVCGSERPLIFSCSEPSLQRLDVYSPIADAKFGISSHYLVEPADDNLSAVHDLRYSSKNSKRAIAGKALVVPISNLQPAPATSHELFDWYINTIEELPAETLNSVRQKFGNWRENTYWVIFTAITNGLERTWFAIKLSCGSKKCLPTTRNKLGNWSINALPVRSFNQENVVRRGGGNPNLKSKRLALFGAGSVGSEIAHKLSAAGINDLTIFDDDIYSIDNLHRHILPERFVGNGKSPALAFHLHHQFPWSKATWSTKKLLEAPSEYQLTQYDLIVIAIGSPTHELLFKQFLIDNKIDVPVLYCWLEGFGVGGHAVLDIPDSKGCILCAYICLESGKRGLNSNLNFLEKDQIIAQNIAGCGLQFINYGAVCSAQTAIMASELAIKYLEGKVTDSCKVSWKGSDEDAIENGVRLTHRYLQFTRSLVKLPLFDEECDVCTGE